MFDSTAVTWSSKVSVKRCTVGHAPNGLAVGDAQIRPEVPAPLVHFVFHLLLGGTGLAVHRWALRRELWQ